MTPEEIVLNFIGAFHNWETTAIKRMQKDLSKYEAALQVAESEYAELITKYFAKSVEPPANVCFAETPTMHIPGVETIESSNTIDSSSAVVRTRHGKMIGFQNHRQWQSKKIVEGYSKTDFVFFEYHLVLENHDWRIASIKT